jgi:hypothetical protein
MFEMYILNIKKGIKNSIHYSSDKKTDSYVFMKQFNRCKFKI